MEWCRGQTPAPYTPEQYNSAPEWMKRYITGNDNQWINAGCYPDLCSYCTKQNESSGAIFGG